MIDEVGSPNEPSALDRHRDELANEFLRVAQAESGRRIPRRLLGRGGIAVLAALVALLTGIAVAATTGTGDRLAPAPAPLFATIEHATNVTSTRATLNGAITADSPVLNGLTASYQFEYGTDASYGNVAPGSPASVGSGPGEVPVSVNLSGLTPGTVYHFRLNAITANGTFHGLDRTFTTPS